ncbi:protein AHNAK2-like, partial [Phasianus colchicus]|uniref:protein AHNAK2-like n=1 Tax=Phasianus colchicus TaxID=9054 RepID=UPI00129D6676
MEVTLKTEVEAGASGFSVAGGGNEGIFIKKVLKESPASKVFSLREGDQLLSATIFFDNIKYEDALKILQYSEPYRVQFSLKRKIAGKEELEHFHSTAQYKKERLSQDKELSESIPEEALHVSGKATSEEDRETLIVNQRVGRSKRPKKDRLSWPKFQSIKNKKILGHRRSHSTSDAYEPAIQDISPTSTDTESQQEIHIKQKKGSQKKLKFPSIGFKMHRSKTEHQDKQKKEINTTLLYEKQKMHKEDISLEGPEILTVEYTASTSEMKTEELHETSTTDLKDVENGIPTYAKKCPEVEISIKKEKESALKYTVPEVQDITRKVSKPSLEADLKETPTKQTPKASTKSRKKKQKGTEDKTEGENGIKVDIMDHTAEVYIEERDLEIGRPRVEIQTPETLEDREKQAEDDKQIPTIQKTKFWMSVPKRKETDTKKILTKSEIDVPDSGLVTQADKEIEKGKKMDLQAQIPVTEKEESTWKITIPSVEMVTLPTGDTKIEDSKVESKYTVKKEQTEDRNIQRSDRSSKIEITAKKGEKDVDGKESKQRLPKFKLPTFTWGTSKDETLKPEILLSETITARDAKVEVDVSVPKVDASLPEAEVKAGAVDVSISAPDI